MAPFPYTIRDIALLYVEDESEARNMLSRMLAVNYPGLVIQVAENGESGLELFRQLRPQIVLTDINMPVMNGIQMAREMRGLVFATAGSINNGTRLTSMRLAMAAIQRYGRFE